MPNEPKFFATAQKYALYYGAGGVGCLLALKNDIFSFPPTWSLYMGWFFSFVTIMCIFLGGPTVVDLIRKVNTTWSQLREMNKEEKEKKEAE